MERRSPFAIIAKCDHILMIDAPGVSFRLRNRGETQLHSLLNFMRRFGIETRVVRHDLFFGSVTEEGRTPKIAIFQVNPTDIFPRLVIYSGLCLFL